MSLTDLFEGIHKFGVLIIKAFLENTSKDSRHNGKREEKQMNGPLLK